MSSEDLAPRSPTLDVCTSRTWARAKGPAPGAQDEREFETQLRGGDQHRVGPGPPALSLEPTETKSPSQSVSSCASLVVRS